MTKDRFQISWQDYVYVGIQGFLFLAFVLIPDIRQLDGGILNKVTGFGILLFGGLIVLFAFTKLGESLTAFPTPKLGGALKTGGMYAWMRHPIYTGIILVVLGWSLYQLSLGQAIIGILLWILFYFKSRYEEEGLERVYGEDYMAYRKKVGRFFPKLF